jgi:hypothetical protein
VGGGGGVRDLSIIILPPESLDQLCLGAVNGGVKFCLLPIDKCSVAAHGKKVSVLPSQVYINAGRSSAYSNPTVAVDALGSALPSLLGELHPREDWLRILQHYIEDHGVSNPLVTPKKCKHQCLPDEQNLAQDSSDSLISTFSSWDLDSPEGLKGVFQLAQKLESRVIDFQLIAGEDIDSVLANIHDVKAAIGTSAPVSTPSTSDEVNTIWESFTLLWNLIPDPSRFSSFELQLQNVLSKQTVLELKSQELSQGQIELLELCNLLGAEQANFIQCVQSLGFSSSPAGS